MSAHLPDRPSLPSLRQQAKALLKQHRDGHAEASARIRDHHPRPDSFEGLRDAQLVIAREYGYNSWKALSEAVHTAIDGARDDRAARFADLACLTYTEDHISRRQQAAELLAEAPELVRADIFAAAAAFDVAAVEAHLSGAPERAALQGGPRDWPPLLYVCYSRASEAPPDRDAVAVARLLLDAGAPGDAFIVDESLGGWRWSGLTGVMGEGENGLLQQPPHAHARALADLLLAHGADPNDAQGLYNTMFTPGNKWLELLLSHGLNASHKVSPGRDETKTLDYQLSQAVKRGAHERVRLLLEHQADASGVDGYTHRTNYEHAVMEGSPEIAAMLIEHGAAAIDLPIEDRFRAAAMRGDKAATVDMLEEDSELIADPSLLMGAVHKLEAVELLLELGADPNRPDGDGGRVLLHEAAWFNSAAVAERLLAAGARSDIREGTHHATPVGFANHAGHIEMRDRLLDHSRDIFDLAHFGRMEQVATLLTENADLAKATAHDGSTPLDSAEAGGHGEVAALIRQHLDE